MTKCWPQDRNSQNRKAAIRLIALFSFAICAWLLTMNAALRAQELVETDGFLNTRIGGRLVRLEAFIARMKDAPETRLPVALITHGKPPSEGRMTDMRARQQYGMHARDFARRGYLAVVVLRRGFGRSDGPSPVNVTCGTATFGDRFEADADDLEAAIAAISQRSDADMSRMIALGPSAGGAAVLTLAARNPKGLLGVVNISGGLRIEGCPKDDLLVRPIADAGARSKVRTLWIYAENDQSFPPAIVDKMHEGWLAQGGDVRRVRVPPMGNDGHTMFGTLTGRRVWLAETDALLRDLELPTWRQIDVRNLTRGLKLPDAQGSYIERYLYSPGEKALARSKTSNRSNFQFGMNTLNEARERAVRACESTPPKEECEIVAENNMRVGDGSQRWLIGPRSTNPETPNASGEPKSSE